MANLIVEKISKKTFFKGRIFLLRTILLWVILLAFVAVLVNTFSSERYDPIDSFLPCVFLLFLWILFVLTIRGQLYWPAFLIISSLSMVAYYLLGYYGTMVPEGWLLLSLTIVMGGILFGSIFSVVLVIIHGVFLMGVTFLQIKGVIHYVSWDETPMMGSAMKATKAGAIIGTAMSDFNGEGTGQILIFIKNGSGNGTKIADLLPGVDENAKDFANQILTQLMWQKNNLALTDLSEIITDRLVAGVEIITPKIVTDKTQTKNLCVGEENNETCITKSQLDQILLKMSIETTVTPTMTPTPTGVGATLDTTAL